MEKKQIVQSPVLKSDRASLSQSGKDLLLSQECPDMKGINQKHLLLFYQLFQTFSPDGKKVISAIEFFKMSKVMKLYPTIVSLETLKRVVMKSPEYWGSGTEPIHKKKDVEFNFDEFIKAFKILSKICYKDVNLKDPAKFVLLSQFLQRGMNNFSAKGQPDKLKMNTDLNEYVESKNIRPNEKFVVRKTQNTPQMSSVSVTTRPHSNSHKNVMTINSNEGLKISGREKPPPFTHVSLKSEVRRSTVQQSVELNKLDLKSPLLAAQVSEVAKSAAFQSLNTSSADALVGYVNSQNKQSEKFQTVQDNNYNLPNSVLTKPMGYQQVEFTSSTKVIDKSQGRSIVSLGGNASNCRQAKGKAYLPQGKRSNKRKRTEKIQVDKKQTSDCLSGNGQSNNQVKLHQQLRNSNLRAVYAQSQDPFKTVDTTSNNRPNSKSKAQAHNQQIAQSLANPRSLRILRTSAQSQASGKVLFNVNARKGSHYNELRKQALDIDTNSQPNLTNMKDVTSPLSALSETSKPGIRNQQRKSIGRENSQNSFRIRKFSRIRASNVTSETKPTTDQNGKLPSSTTFLPVDGENQEQVLNNMKRTIDSDEEPEWGKDQKTEDFIRKRKPRQMVTLDVEADAVDLTNRERSESKSKHLAKVDVPSPEKLPLVCEKDYEPNRKTEEVSQKLIKSERQRMELVSFIGLFKRKLGDFQVKHEHLVKRQQDKQQQEKDTEVLPTVGQSKFQEPVMLEKPVEPMIYTLPSD